MDYLRRPVRIVTLSGENVVAYFNPTFSFNPKELVEKKENKTERFKKGDTYLLQSPECEGFEIFEKEYEVVAAINEVDGIEIDSVVMKQVGGEKNTIFSLSKNDCKLLNIPYERELLLMPTTLNWIPSKVAKEVANKIKEAEKKFTSRNLSTYPLDYETKTIKHMILKLYGFTMEISGFLTTPDRHYISPSDFIKSLRVFTKRPMMGMNGLIGENTNIPFRIVTPLVTKKEGALVDSRNQSIYIELDFSLNGIIPNELEHLEASDCFRICHDTTHISQSTVNQWSMAISNRYN